MAPYGTYRSKKGAIIINAKTQDKEPFDLPAQELKKLIQGIVWREEHFIHQGTRRRPFDWRTKTKVKGLLRA